MTSCRTCLVQALSLALLLSMLVSCSDGSDDDSPLPSGPAAPAELEGVVYTDTEIELFWQPPEGDDTIASYRIMRDGIVLDERDGRSYYDGALSPATSFTYQVMAIDDNGVVGEPALIVLTTRAAGPVVSVDNHEDLLSYVFSVINGDVVGDSRNTVDTFYGDGVYGTAAVIDTIPGLTQLSAQYDPEDFVTRYRYACEDGGEYAFVAPGSAFGGGGGTFDDCRNDAVLADRHINGSYYRVSTLIKYVYSTGWSFDTTYTDLTLTEPDDRQAVLNGTLYEFDGANETAEVWTGMFYTSQARAGQTTISDATISLYAGDEPMNPDYTAGWQRSLNARFSLQAPQTGNKGITVSTLDPLVTSERTGTYLTGRIEVRGVDDSVMIMNADNGDPGSFQVDVTAQGSTSAFTLSWQGALRLRCLHDGSEDDQPGELCVP